MLIVGLNMSGWPQHFQLLLVIPLWTGTEFPERVMKACNKKQNKTKPFTTGQADAPSDVSFFKGGCLRWLYWP